MHRDKTAEMKAKTNFNTANLGESAYFINISLRYFPMQMGTIVILQ